MKTTPSLIIIKLLKTKNAEQILKVARRKKSHFIQRKNDERFLPRNCASQKTICSVFKVLKINTIKLESYVHLKYFFRNEVKTFFEAHKS